MSPKQNTPVSVNPDLYCQHISAKGRRCHMLLDLHHRPPNGEQRSPFCAFHADRLRASTPAPDPELLAAELLGSIEDFSTADAVNLFLGNLVKQLARKRIARRDAIALAYISQLLLNSLPALRRESEDQLDAAAAPLLLNGLLRSRAAQAEQDSLDPSAPTPAPGITS